MLPSQQYRQPDSGAVLAALHRVNAACGYLPEAACGRHRLQVCEGTACYVKGSQGLLAHLAAELGLTPETTTDDQTFTLKQVRCVGSCALAPVVRVDNDTFGRVTAADLDKILEAYRKT